MIQFMFRKAQIHLPLKKKKKNTQDQNNFIMQFNSVTNSVKLNENSILGFIKI